MRYALLDPLRGLAALWVFAFHYEFSDFFRSSFPILHDLAKCGHLGVPMFFVISGYCLTASAVSSIKHGESTGRFIFRRAMRIFPPFWLSILVVVSLPFVTEFVSSLKTGLYVSPLSSRDGRPTFIDFGTMDWIRHITLTQVFKSGIYSGGLQSKFAGLNSVYWTLAIEIQFYTVVSFALLFRRWFFVVLAAITLLSVPFVFTAIAGSSGIFFPYWSMFALGIGLFWLRNRGITPRKVFRKSAPIIALLCKIGMIAFAVFLVINKYLFIGEQGFAVCFAVFLWFLMIWDDIFVSLSHEHRLVIKLPMILLLTLGAMSYSLYLLHAKLRFLLCQFVRQVVPVNSLTCDVITIVGTSLVCYLFYRYCEYPFITTRPRGVKHLHRNADTSISNEAQTDSVLSGAQPSGTNSH